MLHPLQKMMERRRTGEIVGIASYCSANEIVIETALERAAKSGVPTLIEATANQVNQNGGYTKMKPIDFMNYVQKMAQNVHCSKDLIILAGDHLGPLTWSNLPEKEAMANAEELVREYVLAGFTKIHLDTSMRLANDDCNKPLSTEVIAQRGVRLYKICIKAYIEVLKKNPSAMRPVFVIGSEVPIPGGTKEEEEGISVTDPHDFENTVNVYKRVFKKNGEEDGWKDVIAVVVQPGVEYGDSQVFRYDRKAATKLTNKLKEYPEVVFEGHSTDYQTRNCLRQMVEDGIAILKVGPAVTFGMREGMYALSDIEKQLVPIEKRSNFKEVLDDVMIENPKNWNKYYHGNIKELAYARSFSFSDRCRYYMCEDRVQKAQVRLFENLNKIDIPMNILHQYMPIQYNHLLEGTIKKDPKSLVKDSVAIWMKDYEFAVKGQ